MGKTEKITVEIDIDKSAKRIADKALDEFVFQKRTLREFANMILSGDVLEIGKEYTSGDYKIITTDHKGYQTFKIEKRRK